MAADNATMTPDQAIAVLSETRDYREALTSRAAGVLWAIWGLAIAAIGLFSQVYFLGEHSSFADLVSILVFGSAGALASNAVWRSHALQRDPRHAPWIAWVIGLGVPLAVGTVVWLSNMVPGSSAEPGFMLSPLLLLGSAGALAMTLLQRHHVTPLPGAIASGFLLVLFAIARYGGFARTEFMDTTGNVALSLANLVVFGAVAVIHIRRG